MFQTETTVKSCFEKGQGLICRNAPENLHNCKFHFPTLFFPLHPSSSKQVSNHAMFISNYANPYADDESLVCLLRAGLQLLCDSSFGA